MHQRGGMPRLVGDRFFEYDSRHVLDLATGQAITLEDVHRPEGPGPALAPLVEVLEQGREGMPRWLVAVTRSGATDKVAVVETGTESRRRRLSHHAVSSRRVAYTLPRFA